MTTITNIGPIEIDLEQHRDKIMRVVYETAIVKRSIEYTENEKTFTHTLKVDVCARTDWNDRECRKEMKSFDINWSAQGSVPLEWATAYAELINKAVQVAERLTAAYIE
ncbi:MAG: hypothetical protein WC364_13815 [Eubacteriales bacterium]|jgi:hypothetical protein